MSFFEHEDNNNDDVGGKNHTPLITGFMIKRGHVFSSWNKRFFELYSDHLSYYSDELKLLSPHHFRLLPNMLVKDCALRPFCFCIFQPGSDKRNDILYLATYSMEDKDIWMETIMAAIYLLQKSDDKTKDASIASDDCVANHQVHHDQNSVIRQSITSRIFENNQSDPNSNFSQSIYLSQIDSVTGLLHGAKNRLEMRIVKARDIGSKSTSLNPYIQIRVGHSIVRTASREKNSAMIDFNEVFKFELDDGSRFAKIEVRNEEIEGEESVLGTAEVSILTVTRQKQSRAWYQLGSPKGSESRGEVEIEIKYNADAKLYDPLLSFFDMVKTLPNLSIISQLPEVTTKRNRTDTERKLSYLDVFPPYECENLEDMYTTVALMTDEDGISQPDILCIGLLMLSNFRLIYLENMRASMSVAKHAAAGSNMTLSIFIGDIIDISMTSVNDITLNAKVDTMIIKTISSRVYRFGFLTALVQEGQVDEERVLSTWKPPEEVAFKSVKTDALAKSWYEDHQLIHNFARGTFADTRIQEAFYLLCGGKVDSNSHLPHDNYSHFDTNESFEGPCSQRMLKRLRWKVQNRYLARKILTNLQHGEIDRILGKSRDLQSLSPSLSPLSLPDDDQSNYHVSGMAREERESLIDKYVQSWKLYSPVEEFKRMGIPNTNSKWRLCSLNIGYEAISTYPEIIVIPTDVTDAMVQGTIKFRSKGRIPALSYLNLLNHCSITRCSQPMVGITGNRSDDDENFLKMINETTRDPNKDTHKPLIIADARPKINAQANQAAGKGYEFERNYENIKIIFLGIANIHVMRKSLEMAIDVCTSYSDKKKFLRGCLDFVLFYLVFYFLIFVLIYFVVVFLLLLSFRFLSSALFIFFIVFINDNNIDINFRHGLFWLVGTH